MCIRDSAWTVNAEERMEWCIRRELDGVITDDPAVFLDVCRRHNVDEKERVMRLKDYLDVYRLWIWITVALLFFRKRFQPVASQALIEKRPQAKL